MCLCLKQFIEVWFLLLKPNSAESQTSNSIEAEEMIFNRFFENINIFRLIKINSVFSFENSYESFQFLHEQ